MAARLTAVLLAALALAAPAAGQTGILDQATQSLSGDPVYVHPGTDALSENEAGQLRAQIEEDGAAPLFIAILPESARAEAGGSSTGVALRLGRLVGEDGVYAVVVGNQFRAVSNDLARDQAPALATRAFLTHQQDGVAAVLSDFVSRVGDVRRGSSESDADDGGGGFPTWLLLVGGAVAVLLVLRAIRRGRQRERELSDVKTVAREDLVALADDVVGLDEQVEANPQAKEAYLRAMESYQRADDSFDRARSPQDISRVTSALAESRYEMETAKALLAGRQPPEPGPPCFFDPRHGTSTQEITWNSPYAGPIQVSVCEADAQRIRAGQEPEARRVSVGGERRPIWDAPAYFQPWALGFGLAGGMFLGSALEPASASAEAGALEGDGGDWGGGGDFGGGDWGGGGDFGGGGDGGGF